jgi:hypothetical protein
MSVIGARKFYSSCLTLEGEGHAVVITSRYCSV